MKPESVKTEGGEECLRSGGTGCKPVPLDLATIRERLAGVRGQRYWRSLEELAETDEFKEMLHREFPAGATEWWDGLSRRNFLKLAAASLALAGLTACTRQPAHEILPYVKQPEELVPGEPLYYATSMLLGGFATGVVVKSREGHPIKIEGNPDHPSSLGASSVWMQASILDLYDPDRSQSVARYGELSTWAAFLSDLNDFLVQQREKRGAGVRFLTETITSPTLADQLAQVLRKFPQTRWHQFEPLLRDNIKEGARLAFGEIVEAQYRFDRAVVIVALDADFLHVHPERLRYTRQFTDGRRLSAGKRDMNRLYVVESSPTITGSMADHRLPLASRDIEECARVLVQRLGFGRGVGATPAAAAEEWLERVIQDLQAHRGRSIVLAGESQPPAVHALAHLLNARLENAGATVFYTGSAEARPVNQAQSIRELANEMAAGKVEALFMLGGNPVYTAPADLGFAECLAKVNRTVHLSLGLNETSALCMWHIPETHYLEAWGDARAFDGTVSLLQPLIAPLYGGKSAIELMGAMLQQQPVRSDYALVREYWGRQKLRPDFERGWRRALHEGFIAGTALPQKSPRLRTQMEAGAGPGGRGARDEMLEVCFRPDASVWDGQFANNGWLLECPKPLSKLTWDNAALISAALAESRGLNTGDVVELTVKRRMIRCPVWIMPGQAEHSITLHLGYGRTRAGRAGTGVGFDAYRVRASDALWLASDVEVIQTKARHQLVATQTHHNLHSPERQIHRAGTLRQFLEDPGFVKESIEVPAPGETLYNPGEFPQARYQWGMSIDLTTCIGCNACLVACEVENNIPVVGKDQVRRNREMFWIRVDTYYQGSLDNPEFHHMPVPCMHCEHAPCELVCPVAATVHDHEGLNLQIYNRCVGTRFCSNNCPYKVRRFNFYQYAKYAVPSLKPMYNPEVTVRWRGVIEKCTYCIQRISAARIAAEKQNRPIADGEVRTACQQACPAEAIVFGDIHDPQSKVARLKKQPLDYPMLGDLNTRPRTTYLAKVTNPNADLKPGT